MSRNRKKLQRKKAASREAGDRPLGAPVESRQKSKWEVIGICVCLAILAGAVFVPTLWNGFVNYDDGTYVCQNPMVSKGLSSEGLYWAFAYVYACNWHPLTWISHMADCQAYGLRPWGHHLSSVLLHALAAILLFLMLRELTAAQWQSAFVAAVFAVHPLRVESVAWVAERKDVLSGVFFMLTLWAYARYAHARKKGESGKFQYWAVALFLALGLMSKPMLVTVPFVLLLLDYWPLRRFPLAAADSSDEGQALGRINRSLGKAWRGAEQLGPQAFELLCEKLPLFALSAMSCFITVSAQKEAMRLVEHLSPALRAGNAIVAYTVYLGQTVWPVNLAAFYPIAKSGWPAWQVAAALVLLMALSALAFACRRKQPAVVVGWLWYLGMLVPVIGIVQVGLQGHADRYTYLPQIGLLIAGTWVVSDWAGRRRQRRVALAAVAGLILCILAGVARRQTIHWRDSMTLWSRVLDCSPNSDIAHGSLGSVLLLQGQTAEALAHLRKALQINPAYPKAHNNLGRALLLQGQAAEALAHFRKALEINPGYSDAHNNLAALLFEQGPAQEGIEHMKKALQLEPANASYQSNLAWMLATAPQASLRDGAKAVELAEQANQASGGNPVTLQTLAAAYAQVGDFDKAVETAQRALRLAEGRSDAGKAGQLRRDLNLYKSGQPFQR